MVGKVPVWLLITQPCQGGGSDKMGPRTGWEGAKGAWESWEERHHQCTKGPPRPRKCVALGKSLPLSGP